MTVEDTHALSYMESWSKENCRYEELAHTADVGLRIRAGSVADLFACAAAAMFKLIGAIGDKVSEATSHIVKIESVDTESLLVDWLNELLYQHETSSAIYPYCQITTCEPTRLEAVIYACQPAEPPVLHIKAVTYHQLLLTPAENGWLAEIFFDI